MSVKCWIASGTVPKKIDPPLLWCGLGQEYIQWVVAFLFGACARYVPGISPLANQFSLFRYCISALTLNRPGSKCSGALLPVFHTLLFNIYDMV